MEFKINKTKALSENQFAQINKLWNEEYPAKLKDRFPILLEGVSKYNHYLIEDIYKNIIAWAVDFEKEGEIRFSIIVNKSYRGRRLGTRLMERLILEHKQLYGWVIDHNNDLKLDGTYYQSPMNFYLKLGLVAMPDCRIDNDMIKAVKVKWISKTNRMKFHIETERLILREFRETDAMVLFKMDSLPEVHRYLGNRPITKMEQANEAISRIMEQYQTNGIGRWVAIEKSSGNFIGWTGLKFITEPENEKFNFYDVGYRLHPDYWGKGYATESAKASLKYGFDVLKTDEIIGTCHEKNMASQRVLEKCGLKFVEKFVYNNETPCNWLKITKVEWEALTSRD